MTHVQTKTETKKRDAWEPRIHMHPEELLCPKIEDLLCGPLIAAKEESSRLLEKLESVEKERDRYKNYFAVLLESLKTEILTPLLIKEVVKSNLLSIKEIKGGYYFFGEKKVDFIIFLEEEDWDVEEKIYNYYGELLDQFQDKEIYLRVMRLWGRQPSELLPEGFQPW